MNGIVLYDGVCNFCNSSVQFIIKRDPSAYFRFASIQGELGQKLIEKHQITDVDSFLFIKNKTCYVKSDAAFRICRYLKGFWKIFYILLVIPRPIRNFGYDFIAKNRYKWFGKQESCMLPTPDIRKRFLE